MFTRRRRSTKPGMSLTIVRPTVSNNRFGDPNDAWRRTLAVGARSFLVRWLMLNYDGLEPSVSDSR